LKTNNTSDKYNATSDVVLPEVNAPTARASSSALTSRVSVRTTAHETTLNNQKTTGTTDIDSKIFFCIASSMR
jgi:hypothetical protein